MITYSYSLQLTALHSTIFGSWKNLIFIFSCYFVNFFSHIFGHTQKKKKKEKKTHLKTWTIKLYAVCFVSCVILCWCVSLCLLDWFIFISFYENLTKLSLHSFIFPTITVMSIDLDSPNLEPSRLLLEQPLVLSFMVYKMEWDNLE